MDFRQFNDQHWRQTIPETYAAFAKAAAVLEATPMPKPKRMPRPSAEDWQRTTEILNEKLEFLCAVGRENQRVLTTIRNTQRRNSLLSAETKRTPECDRWCYDKWNEFKGRIDIIEAPVNKSKVFDFLCHRRTIRAYLADHGITLSRHFSTAVDNGRKIPPIGTETPWFKETPQN